MSRAWTRSILVLAALSLVPTGCVRRTVTITTAPQGAAVLLNDKAIGTTPVTVDFTWYGDYDVILRKDGYETLKTHHRLQTPWYELPGLDFISEVLVPFNIHDKQEMAFALEKREPINKDALLKNAAEARDRTLFGTE